MTHALSIAGFLLLALLTPLLVLAVVAAGVAAVTKLVRFAARRPTRVVAGPRPAPAASPPAAPGRSYAALPAAGRSSAGAEPALTAVPARDELVPLALWRYDQLVQLELEPLTAAAAALAGVDASAARSLVDRGCPPLLALRILEPV